jgi:hypothetical protein
LQLRTLTRSPLKTRACLVHTQAASEHKDDEKQLAIWIDHSSLAILLLASGSSLMVEIIVRFETPGDWWEVNTSWLVPFLVSTLINGHILKF